MEFPNSYEDAKRAEAYAKLEFPGTYYLAYRDLPEIIFEHVKGRKAIDFGCGTGRSTRFLQKLGFNAIGVDVAEETIGLLKMATLAKSKTLTTILYCLFLRLTIYLRWKRRSRISERSGAY